MMEIGEKWESTHARTDLRMENRRVEPARVPRVDECLDIQSLGRSEGLHGLELVLSPPLNCGVGCPVAVLSPFLIVGGTVL